jgi:hypothetical protein
MIMKYLLKIKPFNMFENVRQTINGIYIHACICINQVRANITCVKLNLHLMEYACIK